MVLDVDTHGADEAARDEIADKQRWWNSATVDARLRGTFDRDHVREAALLLAGLMGEIPGADDEASDIASSRLMLDALKVSEGDLGRLALWVAAARRDPRDLIVAAEYPRELGTLGEHSRSLDLAEYLMWCAGQEERVAGS